MTSRKPTAAFWIVVAVVLLPVVYVGSFGPACWIGTRIDSDDFGMEGDRVVRGIVYFYRPMILTALHCPAFISEALERYAGLGAGNEGPLFDRSTGTFSWRGPGYSANVIDHWRCY